MVVFSYLFFHSLDFWKHYFHFSLLLISLSESNVLVTCSWALKKPLNTSRLMIKSWELAKAVTFPLSSESTFHFFTMQFSVVYFFSWCCDCSSIFCILFAELSIPYSCCCCWPMFRLWCSFGFGQRPEMSNASQKIFAFSSVPSHFHLNLFFILFFFQSFSKHSHVFIPAYHLSPDRVIQLQWLPQVLLCGFLLSIPSFLLLFLIFLSSAVTFSWIRQHVDLEMVQVAICIYS